jgi:hypothetical protein
MDIGLGLAMYSINTLYALEPVVELNAPWIGDTSK